MSTLKVNTLKRYTGTTITIGESGDTITITAGASLTGPIAAAGLTGALPAISGASLTSLNATNLGSGTVPTARLGTGTASSSTVLYGDQTYKAEPGGGKILQVLSVLVGTAFATTSTSYVDTDLYKAITPSSTSNDILIHVSLPCKSYKTNEYSASTAANIPVGLFLTDVSGTKLADGQVAFQYTPSSSTNTYAMSGWASFVYLHSPSSTSAVTYRVGIKTFHSDWTATAFVDLSGNDCVGSMVVMEVDGT